jgi:hypothetical protein
MDSAAFNILLLPRFLYLNEASEVCTNDEESHIGGLKGFKL